MSMYRMKVQGLGLRAPRYDPTGRVQGYSIAECEIFVNPQITPVESPLSNGVCSAEFHWAGADYTDSFHKIKWTLVKY